MIRDGREVWGSTHTAPIVGDDYCNEDSCSNGHHWTDRTGETVSAQTTTLDPTAVKAARLVSDMATTGRLPELIGFSYDFGTLRLHLRDVADLGWLSDLLGLDPEVIYSETDSPSYIHSNYERAGKVGDLTVRVHGGKLEPWSGAWIKEGDQPAYRLSDAEAERLAEEDACEAWDVVDCEGAS